jgi:hypothetical protein
MGITYNHSTNGVSFGTTYTVTATDESDGYVTIEFQDPIDLTILFQIVDDTGKIKSSLNAVIADSVNSTYNFPRFTITNTDEVLQTVTLTLGAGLTGATLEGQYFVLPTPFINYYVWFYVDGDTVDPAPAGLTGIKVTVLEADDNEAVAGKIQAVLDAMTTVFNATVLTNVVTVENVVGGKVIDAYDGDTTIVIAVTHDYLEGFSLLEDDVIRFIAQRNLQELTA